MSYFFGKATSGNSYKKVMQDSDSDLSDTDQETVIFKKSGEIELNLYPSSKEKIKAQSKWFNICVCVSMVVVLVLFASVALYFYFSHETSTTTEVQTGLTPEVKSNSTSEVQHIPHHPVTLSKSEEWLLSLNDTGGEGGLAFADVDGDGIDDIIFGTTVAELTMHIMDYKPKDFAAFRRFCEERELKYPCIGTIVAVRGIDHKELWRINIRTEVFVVDCTRFDFNNDGKMDCIGTGRQGMVIAFDPYKGEQLWVCEDDKFVNASWNTYGVAKIPDWDGDSIPDLILPNGADPSFKPEEHNRYSGRLVLLSGATGKALGTSYLEMPDKHETYMSVVLYTPRDGSQAYALFGSGGETVPGNLYAISLANLCRFFLKKEAQSVCPSKEDKDMWDFMNKDQNGVITLHVGKTKGVMVPPLIVEMTGDNVDDVVVLTHEGAVILLDGQTLKSVWTANFANQESYSTPAPGYFNDDDILDLMVHWNIGAWISYSGSNVSVINGKDGSILWTLDSSYMQATSSLVLSTNRSHQDLFFYRLIGRGSNFRWDFNGTLTNLDKPLKQMQPQRQKRHGDEGMGGIQGFPNGTVFEDIATMSQLYHETRLMCDDDLSKHNEELFLMDRTMLSHPIRLSQQPMHRIYYDPIPARDFTEDENLLNQSPDPDAGNQASHNLVPREEIEKKKMCNVPIPDARTTGGIADVDGDGQLDYVSVLSYQVSKSSADYKDMQFTYFTEVRKLNIGAGLLSDKFQTVAVDADIHMEGEADTDPDLPALGESILPIEKQKWTEYLGKNRDSIYKRT